MALVTITWSNVIARYPLLATFDAVAGAMIVSEVLLEIVNPDWGADANRAAMALAAHLAEMARRGSTGPLTSDTVGPLSQSFAVFPMMHALDTTPYGMEYKRIMESIAAFRFLQPPLSGTVQR